MRLRRRLQRPRHILAAFIARCCLALCRLIPGPVLVRLGSGLGGLFYFLLTKQRRRTLQNLALVYGESKTEAECKQIARNCFRHFGCVVGEQAYLRRGGKAWEAFQVEFEGLEKVDEVLKRGRGLVCTTAHLGNWELCAAYIVKYNLPFTYIALRIPKNQELQDILDEHRKRLGLEIVYARGTGAVASMRMLKKNRIVVLLTDLRTQGAGVMAPFLGIPAHSQVGAAHLAGLTGAGIIYSSCIRTGPWKYHVVFRDPWYADPPPGGSKDTPAWNAYLVRTTERINREISEVIFQYPEQWMWMHRRFEKPSRRRNTVIEE